MSNSTTNTPANADGSPRCAEANGSGSVTLTTEQWANIVAGIRHDGHLVTDLRRQVEMLERYKARMEWLHDCSTGCKDAEGFEWGIYRVKWENGQAVAVWQTNSDFSDLDAEMAREASSQNGRDEGRR
jgi:hypothetical protein